MGRKKSTVDRRQLILDGARELFSRYGFERTTVDDIANHIGIGKGSIYLEFKTKQDVLMSIINEFAEEMHSYFDDFVENSQPPYLDDLKNMLLGCILKIYDKATSNIHTPEALIHTHQKLRSEFSHHFAFQRSRIKDMIVKAADHGEIDSGAPIDNITDTILLAMSGLTPPYLRKTPIGDRPFPSRSRLEREADEMMEVVLAGIKVVYTDKKS